MKKSYTPAIIAGAVALVLSFGSASADTTQVNFNSGSIDELNGSFSFAGFDPSLGTLTGVELSFSTSAAATVSVLNPYSTPANFTNAKASFTYSLAGPDGSFLLTSVPLVMTVASGSVDPATSAGPTVKMFPTTTVTTPEDFTLSSNLSSFEAASPDLTFSSPAGTYSGTTGTSGSPFFGGDAAISAAGTVTYTYTTAVAVPEPSSWAIALICAGLFAFLRFQTRQSNRLALD